MNLTSKRMLKFLSMCAGVCALSASAQTTWVDDNFEAEGTGYTNAAANSSAAYYKMSVWGAQNENTNLVWFAQAGDASKIVATNNSEYVGTRPMTAATTAQVLQLETEGQTLTRPVYVDGVTGNVPFNASSVYVDTLIKFTPSEDTPQISDPNIKIAVFVNVSSNLVVYHKTYDLSFNTIYTNSVIIGQVMDPATWHRLTIKLGYAGDNLGECAAKIYIDGTLLTHYNAFDDLAAHNGSWFPLAATSTQLSQVSFQGTGSIDELVVADFAPGISSSAILLTLSFDTAMVDVLTNGVAAGNYATVKADTDAIQITAKPWYTITSPGSLFVGGSTTNYQSGTTMITAINGTVAGTAGQTNTVLSALYNVTNGISTGLGGSYPADKVAQWAINSGLNPGDLTAGMLDNYLLNIDESKTATLVINSIVWDDANNKAIITVGASGADAGDVNFTGLNGTLLVWTSDDLIAWGLNSYTITSTTATTVTIEVPQGAGQFIRARVQ